MRREMRGIKVEFVGARQWCANRHASPEKTLDQDWYTLMETTSRMGAMKPSLRERNRRETRVERGHGTNLLETM